jgi:CubicO group peptidase (beta-lactamase class C family)
MHIASTNTHTPTTPITSPHRNHSALRQPVRHGVAYKPLAVAALTAALLAACGEGGDDNEAAFAPSRSDASASTVSPATPSTPPPVSEPTAGTVETTEGTVETTARTVETTVDSGTDQLSTEIEALLTEALAPGSIRWDFLNGVDAPATAAVAAVRIPGRDDVVVAVGENVDGTPAEADAPFLVSHLAESLVRTIAFQLIDEGVLDPSLTVDQWVPTLPNADRVTVQMLIDNQTGWSDSEGLIEPDPVVSDLGRAWSLREAMELRASVVSALGEPGTPTDDGHTNEFVLGVVVEEVGGQPLAELVRARVAGPAGLDDTSLIDVGNIPGRTRHGFFVFDGTAVPTSAFDPTSYFTWFHATHSSVSTPTDLLDLLDVWATGELFTTDRTPAPQRYAPEPVLDDDGNADFLIGREVPFNGFCPCTKVDDGFVPKAFGRAPAMIGTLTFLLRYDDGVSVVVNVNSNEADPADIEAVTTAVHDIAVAAR